MGGFWLSDVGAAHLRSIRLRPLATDFHPIFPRLGGSNQRQFSSRCSTQGARQFSLQLAENKGKRSSQVDTLFRTCFGSRLDRISGFVAGANASGRQRKEN
jgi:hypothetical protein